MDLNKDGFPDILSGSYSRSGGPFMAGLFQVLWGTEGGGFKKAEALKGKDGEPLVMPALGDQDPDLPRICTRPFAVDWDGDGDLDIVSGNFAGTLFVIRGEGGGKFAPKAELVKEAGSETPLQISGVHSDPFVIDFDGDKDLDLISGSGSGGVQIALNKAGPGAEPSFDQFEQLIAPPAGGGGGLLKDGELPDKPSTCTRVWVQDLNEDGKLDLLVGDRASLGYPAEGLNVTEAAEKEAEWKKAMEKVKKDLQAPLGGGQPKEELMEQYRALVGERSEFITEKGTGFVWAFLQK